MQEELAANLGDDFDEVLGRFFMRPVSSRWLEMGPVVVRMLQLWESTTHYFLHFLPSSKVQCNKKACKSKKYKMIAAFLSEGSLNLARLQFVAAIERLNRPFLLKLQACRPLVHELYSQCVSLFKRVGHLIIKDSKLPKTGEDVAALKLTDNHIFKKSKDCEFVESVTETLKNVGDEEKDRLLREMKEAVKAELTYLQSHLPFKNKFIQNLTFLHPDNRAEDTVVTFAMEVATAMKRFTLVERNDMRTQVLQYKSLDPDQVPSFDNISGRLDHYWTNIFNILNVELVSPPVELQKLVKMCCSLSHGNAAVESSFSTSKFITKDRNCLSIESVIAQKLILSAVRAAGGADKVPITSSMINSVKHASAAKIIDDKKKQEEKRKAEADSAAEAAAKKRKTEIEEEKRSWEEKKKTLENNIKVTKEEIGNENKNLLAAVSRGTRLDNTAVKNAALGTIKSCQEIIARKNGDLEKLQEKLNKLLERKPKEKQ